MAYFLGSAADDTFIGTSEQDTLYGFDGDDHLEGGAANDTLEGDHGSDTLIGGAQDDYLSVYVDGLDVLDGGDGNDSFTLSFDYASPGGWIVEPGSIVRLSGGGGNDFVEMRLAAPSSDIQIEIDVGDGADVIAIDGYRAARVTLGSGQDVLQPVDYGSYQLTADSAPMVITDFQPGQGGDLFAWAHFLQVALSNYDRTANPFATGHARLVQSDGDTLVQLDLDGVGTERAFTTYFRLEGIVVSQLTAANFAGYPTNGGAAVGTVLVGGDGFDRLFGWAGADRIEAGGGNDWVVASHGDDVVLGGAGADDIFGQDGDDRLEGQTGDDRLNGAYGNDTLIGGDGNDTLTDLDGGADLLDGGAGADSFSLWKRDAADLTTTLLGGADGDSFSLTVHHFGKVIVDGGTGDDILYVHGLRGSLDVTLGAGADQLKLNKGGFGLTEGRITIRDFDVAAGGDRLIADSYFMTLFPSWDGVTSPFEQGLFRLVQIGADSFWEFDWEQDAAGFLPFIKFQGIAADQLSATHLGGFAPGTIHYFGTAQANTITGSARGDLIDGGAGADSLTGRGGDDFYRVDDISDKVIEAAGGGVDTVESRVDYTLPAEVERLTLVGAAVEGTGNALANIIVGNEAANRLDGGAGADRLEGGAGNDLYIVDAAGDRIVELSGAGNDTARSSVGYSLSANVENLVLTGGGHVAGTGNSLVNSLTGNGGNNRLDGAGGADTMAGGAGHDVYVVNHVGDQVIEAGSSGTDTVESSVTFRLPIHFEKLILTGSLSYDGTGNAGANTITGNAGGNFLNGGRGNDVIAGGAGNDRLMGNIGIDSLTGGAGADRFYFNAAPGSADADRILDFSAADDSFYLLRSVFTRAGANGTLAPGAFHQGTSAADAGDRIVYDAATGNLFYDADGSGAAAALLFATVAAGTPLTHADFVIYG